MRYIENYEIFEARSETKNYMLNCLAKNFCVFMYIKKSGEKRYAFGTLIPSYLKKVWTPTGKKRTAPPNNIVYWDLSKNGFRQFNPLWFVKMLDKNPDIVRFADAHPVIYKKLKPHFPKKEKSKKEIDTEEQTNNEKTEE